MAPPLWGTCEDTRLRPPMHRGSCRSLLLAQSHRHRSSTASPGLSSRTTSRRSPNASTRACFRSRLTFPKAGRAPRACWAPSSLLPSPRPLSKGPSSLLPSRRHPQRRIAAFPRSPRRRIQLDLLAQRLLPMRRLRSQLRSVPDLRAATNTPARRSTVGTSSKKSSVREGWVSCTPRATRSSTSASQ